MMDMFGSDYDCRTVGEGLNKYDVSGDWRVEFDIYDGAYPMICISAGEICGIPDMMALKLRIVEDEDAEYAGCMVFPSQKLIVFKLDHMCDLIKGMEKLPDTGNAIKCKEESFYD